MNKRELEVQQMRELIEGCFYLNNDTDLIYSPYDNVWSIVDYRGDHRSSISYSSKAEAIKAYITNTVKWEQ